MIEQTPKRIGLDLAVGIIILCVLTTVTTTLAAYSIAGNPFFSNKITQFVDTKFGSCEGIEEIYNGTDFMEGAQRIISLQNNCYNHKLPNATETIIALPPKTLLENCTQYNYDCEDVSYAIVDCLAPKYNITCERYNQAFYKDPTYGEILTGHSGTTCLISGKWVKIS